VRVAYLDRKSWIQPVQPASIRLIWLSYSVLGAPKFLCCFAVQCLSGLDDGTELVLDHI